MREITYETVTHPQFLGDFTYVAVPGLTEPNPVIGWAGDTRLAVYWTGEKHILYRLEADGEYRGVCEIQGRLGQSTINRILVRLVEIDMRNGWNPLAEIEKVDAETQRDKDRELTAEVADFADKLHYGLSRSHIPGIDVTRVRNT